MKKGLFLLMSLFSQLAFGFNPDHLKQLQETCSCTHCDLTNANLASFKLGDSATLNMQKVKLNRDGFIVCNLNQADFSGANLQNAYFSVGDFAPGVSTKVGKVLLREVNFRKSNLTGAHFNSVSAELANFSGANLQNASFLKGSNFSFCNFSRALMTNMSVSPPMGGCGAFFVNSNFTYANLSGSRLNADFTSANFSRANLTNTQLTPCDNQTSDSFDNTNFLGANLVNARSGDKLLTEDLLSNATLCRTRLSSGMSDRDC